MESQYEEPVFNKDAFNCPHCQVYAKMDFWDFNNVTHKINMNINGVISSIKSRRYHITKDEDFTLKEIRDIVEYYNKIAPILSICHKCKKVGIWIEQKMVYPKARLTPLPNEDLPDDIRADYEEASNIVQDSPRGACALLRLALQKLMIYLGEDKNLDRAIKDLMEDNRVDEDVRKALDSVRIVGNSAVHKNELEIKDKPETALKLFQLLNFIANEVITSRKEVRKFYSEEIPENAKRENREK